ncbi:MAG TPA: hypothetical protein VGQ05_20605 [Streptosporangiaceae bacterium]|nr:hypothetical protein [Streptosporangiaceae bacterium]
MRRLGTVSGHRVSIRWRGTGALGHASHAVSPAHREQGRGACFGQFFGGLDSHPDGAATRCSGLLCPAAAGHEDRPGQLRGCEPADAPRRRNN